MKIYVITNQVNGNQYIGSETIPGTRKKTHLWHLRRRTHHSKYLQNAFNTHGEHSFIFETLEDNIKDNTALLAREQHYIDTLNPVYNMCKVAGNSRGIKLSEDVKKKISAGLHRAYSSGDRVHCSPMRGKKHSDETKLKISLSGRGRVTTDEARANISASRIAHGTSPAQREANRLRSLGRHPTEETRAKLRFTQQNRTNKPASMETRAKMSAVHKARWAARKVVA